MGVVYKARQLHLKRIVALKVLIAGELATEAQVARFRREAQAAARLRHPAIVPIHEIDVFDGKHFYTMDYIEGRSLGDLIRAGEVTTRRALNIAAQVADALGYAHSNNVIHRDIKPGNIMVDAGGGVHILDFGLAKQVDSDSRFTRTGTTIGTPAYMPPEQASGQSRHVDHRADIYALGAVLYEMLTSRPPFSGDNMMSTLMRVLNDEPPPPKRLNPRIHRDIQTIVLKAMEKSPERRYPTMRAFAEDIRRFIAGESISARPAGILYRGWRFFKRHYTAVFASAAVIAIALAAIAAILEIRRESERREEAAYETGKRKGAQDLEKKLEQQERPTVKTVFEDHFTAGPIAKSWVQERPAARTVFKPGRGPWRLTEGGELEVAAGPLAAIYTKKKFTGNVTVEFEVTVPVAADGSAQREPVVGCFLGTKWLRSYRVFFGGRARPRLALMDRRREVAEVECEPLAPDTTYCLVVKRDSVGIEILVESEGGERLQELTYKELSLPRQLERQFAAGLFAERTRMRVRRFRVRQEFPPAKLSPLKAAEGLFRDGNIAEARNQCKQIAQGYEGRYEGLAALFRVALCHEAERHHKQATPLLRGIESRALQIQHDELPGLVNRARLHHFFCSASLNDFRDAVQALARIAAARGHVDEAWVWHFPKYVADMISNRAYDEALALLHTSIFGPQGRNLYGIGESLRARTFRATLTARVRQLADGFCNNGRPEKVREVYAAYPTATLADAFARAASATLRGGKLDEALSLLAFCHTEKMASSAVAQATIDLANRFCETGNHARLAKLYEAVPEPRLAPAFVRAVRETTDAGRLDEALALLELCVENFPADRKKLLGPSGPVIRLGRAFVAGGQFLKPIAVHTLFEPPPDEPSLVALFAEATQQAIAKRKTDEARRLLTHCYVHFGVLHKNLAAAAARLVALHAADGAHEKVAEVYVAYPNEALAAPVAKVIADAAASGRLAAALTLFGHYARNRHAMPTEAVRALAESLAALDPELEETERLLAQYGRVYEIYDRPDARSTLILALGDAYVRAGRLRGAAMQYDAAGDLEGLLRAGCVLFEVGEPEQATARWQLIRERAEEGGHYAAIAAFMLGETALADFTRAAAALRLAPALTHYLAGLRLWAEDDSRAEQEFAQAGSGRASWFTPLAKRARGRSTPDEEVAP